MEDAGKLLLLASLEVIEGAHGRSTSALPGHRLCSYWVVMDKTLPGTMRSPQHRDAHLLHAIQTLPGCNYQPLLLLISLRLKRPSGLNNPQAHPLATSSPMLPGVFWLHFPVLVLQPCPCAAQHLCSRGCSWAAGPQALEAQRCSGCFRWRISLCSDEALTAR